MGERTRSFLKVQDGCDYTCSFCTIHLARGKSRSANVADTLIQAREIAETEIKEIVLTGVNIGDFGKKYKESFFDLIQKLDKVEGIERYRISSIEPNLLSDEIIYFTANSEKFLPEKSLMEDVFLQVRQEENLGVLASDNAYFQYDRNSGNKYIVFNDGRRYVGEPDTLDSEITEYEKYAILIENVTMKSEILKTYALSTEEIISSDNMNYKAEFQWRISLIIICFCLSLFSVLLVQSSSNEKRYTPFVIGISVYLIYSNLLGIAQTLLRREIIPEFGGLLSVHIIFMLVLFILYYFQSYFFGHG